MVVIFLSFFYETVLYFFKFNLNDITTLFELCLNCIKTILFPKEDFFCQKQTSLQKTEFQKIISRLPKQFLNMACLHTGNLDPESQFQSKQWKQSKIKIYNKVNSSNHSIKGINIKHKYINILNVYACIDINHFVFFLQHQLLELNTIKCYFYFSSS